jgi:hypothetical protein
VAWLAGFRRLHRRYERKAEHFLAFTGIASRSSATDVWLREPVHATPRNPGSAPSNCRHESRLSPRSSAIGTARRLVASRS